MSNLSLSLILVIAAMTTAWVVIKRRKDTMLAAAAEEEKERQAMEQQQIELKKQKYKQLQIQLKDPLIQSLWALLEEAFSLELIEKFSDEQFKVSQDDQHIDLAMSWVAKDNGVAQLALRRLVHKHATDIALHHSLFLTNMICDESRLELQFNEKNLDL